MRHRHAFKIRYSSCLWSWTGWMEPMRWAEEQTDSRCQRSSMVVVCFLSVESLDTNLLFLIWCLNWMLCRFASWSYFGTVFMSVVLKSVMWTTSGQIMHIITRDGFVISLISAQLLIVMIFSPRTVVLGNYFTGFNSLKMGVAYYSTFSWMIVLNDIAEICVAIPQTINMNDQAIMHNTLCRSYVCSALTAVVCSHFQIPTQTTLIPPPPKASTTPWILTACWWRPSAAWEGNQFSGPPIPHCCSLPLQLLHGQQPQGDYQKVLHSKP